MINSSFKLPWTNGNSQTRFSTETKEIPLQSYFMFCFIKLVQAQKYPGAQLCCCFAKEFFKRAIKMKATVGTIQRMHIYLYCNEKSPSLLGQAVLLWASRKMTFLLTPYFFKQHYLYQANKVKYYDRILLGTIANVPHILTINTMRVSSA